MKVVQQLYAYMISKSEFHILPMPETASRDKRFAYRVYVDLLLNVLRLSGIGVGGCEGLPGSLLESNKMAKSLLNDSDVKEIIARYADGSAVYDDVLPTIYDKIVESAAYKDYKKLKERTIVDDINLWKTVIYTIISTDAAYEACARRLEEFTAIGFKRGINDFVNTIADFSDSAYLLHQSRAALKMSFDKAYDMYCQLLVLPLAITRAAEEKLENAKQKYLPTPEDLNPNTRFVDNSYVARLAKNPDIADYLRRNSAVWTDDFPTVNKFLKLVEQSPFYVIYMKSESVTPDDDARLWRDLMVHTIFQSDELANYLEAKSIFWNDDLVVMGTFVVKTMRAIATADDPAATSLLPEFKDEEDSRFGVELFDYVVDNQEEYRTYINRYVNTARWEADRLALMDIIILMTAIAEILNYPAIPTVVSINEYIEIAKYYSTNKSGQFVNGILSSVVNYFKSQYMIFKD